MEVLTSIKTRKTSQSRLSQVDMNNLEFGKYVSDHMLVCDYANEEWQSAQIVPFTNLSMSPATLALHYGQTVFEGMKAFRMLDGRVNIFRIERHYDRFVRSLDRMCMAAPPKEIFTEGLQTLIELDKAWVPSGNGSSLYIRPFVYASEAKFGVKVSDQYRFLVFTGPVPALYAKPIKVKVETEFVRATRGGTGYAKCGGNYGGAYYPTQQARKQGYDQVLWTDGSRDPAIEESGMMNAMFVIDDRIVTPELSDSILDGVTRDSLLTIAESMGIKVEERRISVRELKQSFEDGRITEAFGVGTAAVVTPIGVIGVEGVDYSLPSYSTKSVHVKIASVLEDVRSGRREDVYGWNTIIG